MIHFTPIRRFSFGAGAFISALLMVLASSAQAQPSQKPLLSGASGAKPNLMLTIDNSGSMAFNYHETYNVTTGIRYERRNCLSPAVNSSSVAGGEATFDGTNYQCWIWVPGRRGGGSWQFAPTQNVSMNPVQWQVDDQNGWNAQRASEVNPMYYNPRITYAPRVNSMGVAVPVDANDKVVFISNQNSANFVYDVLRKGTDDSIKVYHSMYADDADTVNMLNVRNSTPPITDFTSFYRLPYSLKTPVHKGYTTLNTANPPFSYTLCTDVVTVSGKQTSCNASTQVDVTQGTGNITLPTDHKRSKDEVGCSGNVCTMEAERKNVMNWYRYYSNRALAAATAIGQALVKPEFNKQLRIGYMNINRRVDDKYPAIDIIPGGATDDLKVTRGVRMHERGSAETEAIYKWLYETSLVVGGTPLHNALDKVASYYKVATGAKENPWMTDPTPTGFSSSTEQSCRRSFNLLFSDGGWNVGTATNSATYADGDNIDGPVLDTNPALRIHEVQYKPAGESSADLRKWYTPYASEGTNSLADLAIQYYWHEDLRTALANKVNTYGGQPIKGQNMTTYTVGYLIRPSGEVPGATSGLTFKQISDYQKDYLTNGLGGATAPSWPTGDLNVGSTDAQRVNDFIHAGFTGGGKGFSAQTAEDVRTIFSKVLEDVLNSSGNDAGVSVSSSNNGQTTTTTRLKYGVEYKTLDNSGDVVAYELDDEGNVKKDTNGKAIEKWRASTVLYTAGEEDKRNIFSRSGPGVPGGDVAVTIKGRFDALNQGVRDALKQGPDAARIADDESFVNYLRGKDGILDPANKMFRVRAGKMGSMVNPPSTYMGGQSDSMYDKSGDIEGSVHYRGFADRKRGYPESLFVATNAGMMHAMKAEEGTEMAAYMPRRSLKRMLNYANDPYTFEYVLDGPISEHDVYSKPAAGATGSWKNWNHIAIGTGGRGERLIYAVKSPITPGSASSGDTKANRTPGKDEFLWETGPDLIDSASERLIMGYPSNPVPKAGQTLHRDADKKDLGKWIVAVNNGHYNGSESTGTNAGLVVLDALTGEVIKRIPLPEGVDAGRGLSGVTILRDTDDTNRIVGAYAGDAKGNLWRFHLSGDPSTWKVAYGKPLFSTPNHAPIYGAPAWQMHPKGGFIVVFATGMLLDEDDKKSTLDHHIYGIWDPTGMKETEKSPFTTVGDAELLEQELLTATKVSGKAGTRMAENEYFKTTTKKIDWKITDGTTSTGTHRGWKMKLGVYKGGERSIAEVKNFLTSVVINTTVVTPTDSTVEMCSASGLPGNFIYVLRAVDGYHTKGHDINDEKDSNGKKQAEDYAVSYLPEGGFTRGTVLDISRITNPPAAAEDPNEPGVPVDGYAETDPKQAISDTLREAWRINEAGGESRSQRCKEDSRELFGTASEAMTVFVNCPAAGWSRTQYQLSGPAAN